MSRSHESRSPAPRSAAARAALGAAASLAMLLAACSPSRTAPPPAQPDPASALSPPELSPGARVLVERGGQWLPAAVVARAGADRVRVHYDGYGPEWDEAVGFDRIRPAPTAAADYQPGEKVLVTSQGRLLLAEIVQQTAADAWRIHYDGYGPEVAENVKADRIRRPFDQPTAHAPGHPVQVDVSGRPMPGRVLAALAPDRWLVRFDGFGPEYDQEVTADRLRPGAAAGPPAVGAASAAATSPAASASAGASPAPAAPAAAPAASFKQGDEVLVAHRGAYHPAVIVGPGAAGKWRVRYATSAVGTEGSRAGSDEDVAADRVSPALMPQKGVRYQLQQNVFVEWHGLFFPGRVVKTVDKGQYRVRFEGFGPEADEILPARRLRPRP